MITQICFGDEFVVCDIGYDEFKELYHSGIYQGRPVSWLGPVDRDGEVAPADRIHFYNAPKA